ncbi:polyphosphate:nucleotide phosphotransferase, PPK2 family [Frankineae bacterium MT45]|nr:polyphosphate:nucleotide phosphotransferase, PPK2 family [Frankineae bacterium MT45]
MSHRPQSLRSALAVAPGTVNLAGYDSSATPLAPGKKKATVAASARHAGALGELQERLFAERSRSLLLVLQGIDTAGKGGVISHVVGLLGPEGTTVTAFKKPTPEEAAHHFLWRIRRALPERGMVAAFDRSHYEDVIVTRVHETIPQAEWARRYEEINAFESALSDSGTVVVKCFLNISYATQRERQLARLDDPTKRWKFQEHDIDERAYWSDYQVAYTAMIQNCSTEVAPWYIVPSDHKWYRNWAVGEILQETLTEMDPQYPKRDLDLPRLRRRLAPPY